MQQRKAPTTTVLLNDSPVDWLRPIIVHFRGRDEIRLRRKHGHPRFLQKKPLIANPRRSMNSCLAALESGWFFQLCGLHLF
jgi:hypothetical protein